MCRHHAASRSASQDERDTSFRAQPPAIHWFLAAMIFRPGVGGDTSLRNFGSHTGHTALYPRRWQDSLEHSSHLNVLLPSAPFYFIFQCQFRSPIWYRPYRNSGEIIVTAYSLRRNRRRNRVEGTARYRLDDRAAGFRSSVRFQNVPFSMTSRPSLRLTQPPMKWVQGVLSPEWNSVKLIAHFQLVSRSRKRESIPPVPIRDQRRVFS
jgi:hypothetical protein